MTPDRMPLEGLLAVPWVIAATRDGDDSVVPDWTTFHPQAVQAHHNRLCQVCGMRMDGLVVLGRADTDRWTSGPGCHPRCMALTLAACPHFLAAGEQDVVAYRYDGDGVGYDTSADDVIRASEPENVYMSDNPVDAGAVQLTRAQVRDLARRDPLGVAALVTADA
jgi:hypothetical protein